MAGNSFRYDLTLVKPYFVEYYKAYNEWKDIIDPLTEEEYALNDHQDILHKLQYSALEKISDDQVRELIKDSGSMTSMYLCKYLENREERLSGLCKPTLENFVIYSHTLKGEIKKKFNKAFKRRYKNTKDNTWITYYTLDERAKIYIEENNLIDEQGNLTNEVNSIVYNIKFNKQKFGENKKRQKEN